MTSYRRHAIPEHLSIGGEYRLPQWLIPVGLQIGSGMTSESQFPLIGIRDRTSIGESRPVLAAQASGSGRICWASIILNERRQWRVGRHSRVPLKRHLAEGAINRAASGAARYALLDGVVPDRVDDRIQ